MVARRQAITRGLAIPQPVERCEKNMTAQLGILASLSQLTA